ncbi:pilus assembly protein N-terminal domain-containing protein, partial [Methylobacterium sp. WL64]|uniref:pilus assembly protein N-terminal domain-containing protein n=1 Tax=Methylobacterium sp. WL64 TaxID=2603894 RepID=UPI00164EE412
MTLLIFCTPVWAQTYPAPSSGKKHRPSLSAVSEVATSQDVELLVKQGRLLQLPGIASKIMVADPKVASFQVSSPSSVFVFGEGAGTTSLYAMDAADNVIAAMRLVVTFDLAQLRKQVEAEVPGTHVEIVPAGDKALIVRGSVKTPINARQVMSTISAAIGAPDEGGGKGGGGGGGG